MKLKDKSRIITYISIMLIILNVFIIIFYGFKVHRLLLTLLSILVIVISNTKKELYLNALLFGLMGIIETHPGMLIITGCGMFSSFMKSDDEIDLKTFIKKNTLLASIIVGISGISLVSYGSLINYCTEFTYGADMISEFTACICLGIIIYICHKYKFIIKNEVSFFEMIKISLPIWLFLLVSASVQISVNVFTHEFQSASYIILLILNYLLVGLFEEFLLRGIVLNILLDKYKKNRKDIWFAVVVSSLLFGLAHYMNLSTGANFFGVTMQVISATAMGIYLAAIYLRTNNIWYNSLIHGLWDVCASITFIFVGNEMEYGEVISGYNSLMLIPAIFYFIFALFLLRKKKINEIVARINDKEYVEKKNNKILGIQHFFASAIVIIVIFITVGAVYDFKFIDDNVRNTYNNLPKYNYGEEYIFKNKTKEKDLSNEIRAFMTMHTIDTPDPFIVSDEDFADAYKELFDKKINKDDYVDFRYDSHLYCYHEENKYNCTYQENYNKNVKVYSGIKTYTTDGSEVIIEMYYLLENINIGEIYGDSSFNNLIYSGDITTLTDKKYNIDDVYNKEFFNSLSKKIEVPVYKVKYEIKNPLNGLVFKGVEIDTSKLDIDIKYDKNVFDRIDYHNTIILQANKTNIIEIKAINQSTYMDKLLNSSIVYYGKNKYYYNRIESLYLINNRDNYYTIKVTDPNNKLLKQVMEVLENLDI